MTDQHRLLDDGVDFTMMYVAHDAFARDLRRIAAACERGDAFTPQTRAGWEMFARQLHVHHSTEDSSLWPRLRAQPLRPDEVQILDAMEMEHVELDPQIDRIENAFADCDVRSLIAGVRELSLGLVAHMRHEESDALPLINRHLGAQGWDEFGRDIRRTLGGLRGGATYLPWVLDGASAEMRRNVFIQLPAPARLLCRWVWQPKYDRTNWWGGAGQA